MRALAVLDVELAFLLDAAFLHLEQVGEVGFEMELEPAERRLLAVVVHGDVLAHAAPDVSGCA